MTTVGLLYPGEMGAMVAATCVAEVTWASEGRSGATRARADQLGLTDAGTLAELVSRSDVILSICPPAVAEHTAREVAAVGFDGLYVDANAISPARAQRIAALFERAVDGSIVGRETIHLYLSGDPVELAVVAALFDPGRLTAIPLDGGIGAASALKVAFASWNKIGIALAAQSLSLARAWGLEEALAAEGVEPRGVVRAGGRAWRWVAEMEEIGDTFAEVGLPDGIARGAADLYARWDEHRDTDVPLERLLDDLRE